jgi:hypothetical protein
MKISRHVITFDSKDSAFPSILILRQHFEHGQKQNENSAAEKDYFFIVI